MFSREAKETYYVAPLKKIDSKDEKSEVSKEKLPDKWRNRCSFIRNAHNLLKNIEPGIHDSSGSDGLVPDSPAEISENWLMHNNDPLDFQTFSLLLLLQIDKDFVKKFPEVNEQLVLTFKLFFNQVHSLFGKKLNANDQALVTQLKSETLSQSMKNFKNILTLIFPV